MITIVIDGFAAKGKDLAPRMDCDVVCTCTHAHPAGYGDKHSYAVRVYPWGRGGYGYSVPKPGAAEKGFADRVYRHATLADLIA